MKKLFWAAMLPLAFTACTNEDVVLNDAPVVDGNMITLNKNFAIGVTKGEPASRAQFNGSFSNFEWMPTLLGDEETQQKSINVDKVGLSWIQGGDGKVYTNYEFEHYAWPVKDAETPSIDECSKNWKNLVFLTENDYVANGSEETTGYVTDWAENLGQVEPTTKMEPVKGSGYFKTNNLSIFTGDYVIYSPYNAALNQVDYLKATAKEAYNLNAVKLGDYKDKDALKKVTAGLGNEVFYVGSANVTGGATVNGFHLDPITGFVQLNIALGDNVAELGKSITKIAVFAEDGIVTEQAIDASKVKDNLKGSLIAGTEKAASSVLVNLNEDITIEKNAYSVFIPVLPQTIEDAKVVLFAEDGSSLMVEAGDIEVAMGAFAPINITLTAADKLQTEVYYVIDMETFRSAMVSAGTSGKETATINLLNDITYDQTYLNENGLVEVVNDMTITGNDIIVPEGQSLKVVLSKEGKLTMNGELVINEGCCGKAEGKVILVGADALKNSYLFNGNVTNDGSLKIGGTLATVAEFAAIVENNGVIEMAETSTIDYADVNNGSEGTIVLSKNATAEVENLQNDGDVIVNAYNKLTIAETLTNNGDITILASGSGESATDGNVVIADEATAANNGTINNKGVYDNYGSTTLNAGSEFIDYVGSQYGVNMPTLVGDAEYICEVDGSEKARLAYALGTKMKTTTVRFVGDYTHEYQLKDYANLAKLATVKYIVDIPETRDLLFKNAATNEITLGTSLVIENAKSVKFNGGKTKVNGNIVVNKGMLSNNGHDFSAQVTANDLTLNNDAVFVAEYLKGASAASELTAASWTVNNVALNGNSILTVEEKAAVKANGSMTIAKDASATFAYSSYSEFAGSITNNGTFERVLSSTTGQKENPAQVWCSAWTNNGSTVGNAGAQVAK